MSNEKFPIIDSLLKEREIQGLSFELVEVTYTLLNEMFDYCKANDIPIYENKGMFYLLERMGHLFTMIEKITSSDFNPLKISMFNLDIRRKFTDPSNRRRLDRTFFSNLYKSPYRRSAHDMGKIPIILLW